MGHIKMKYLHIYDRMHPEYAAPTAPGHEYVYYESLIGAVIDPANTVLIKEDCHSDVFLRLYLSLCNPKRNFCSHVLYMRHRAALQQFILTDAAMNIQPTLEQFVKIINNADYVWRRLADVEDIDNYTSHVNFLNYSGGFSFNNNDALTASHLARYFEWNDPSRYYFTTWQLDTCLYQESRKKKLGGSQFCPNIIVAPNISVGNAIYKCLMKEYDCYGFVVGGEQIGILNSRSDLDKNEESIKILEQIRDKND